jgi:hypothetical protein
MVLRATVAGAEEFVEIRRWGTTNQDFLRPLAGSQIPPSAARRLS